MMGVEQKWSELPPAGVSCSLSQRWSFGLGPEAEAAAVFKKTRIFPTATLRDLT